MAASSLLYIIVQYNTGERQLLYCLYREENP